MTPHPVERERSRFQGVGRIVRYNVHWYASAVVVIVLAVVLALNADVAWLRWVGWVVAASAVWFLAASIIGSYWIYDHARLNEWVWLRRHIAEPKAGQLWLSLDVGSDLGIEVLEEMLPGETGEFRTLDVPSEGKTRSLSRAQAEVEGEGRRIGLDGIERGSLHRVFLLQAAHELRRRSDRERLFDDIARCLVSGGELVLVEHVVDIPNLLIWGPGAFHNYPLREWLRLGERASLRLQRSDRHSPFARVVVFRKPAKTSISTP